MEVDMNENMAPAERVVDGGRWGPLRVVDLVGAGLDWLDARAGGHYATVIEIPRVLTMNVGSLGRVGFPPGTYVNVGTMAKGLVRRVARHLTRNKDVGVWHVDRLTTCAAARVLGAVMVPCAPWTEHTLSLAVGTRLGLSNPIPKFSSKDCKAGCASHLWFSHAPLSLAKVAAAVDGVCAMLVEPPRAVPSRKARGPA